MNTALSTLCRICLEDGATLPLFENNENDDIYSKLIQCVNEKIEDVEGFPRSICNNCTTTVDTVYHFINKYKESSKILQNGLLFIKNESIDHSNDYITFGNSDTEDFKVKSEVVINYENDSNIDVIDDLLTKSLKPKIKTKRKKENIKKRCNKRVPINKTNKIASSILEGEFTWNGESWCLKSNEPVTLKHKAKKKEKEKIELKAKNRNRIELNIPKVAVKKSPKLCDLCGQIFKTQDKLTIHKRNKHFNNPVKCPKCPRICVSDYYLKRHIKRRHNTEKNFICSSCGHRFAFKGELSTHYRNVHNKHLVPKKVYKCSICDKTYKCQKSVIVHERSVHTGLRPAVCNVCNSSFYHEDYLKEHMRLHTGETPFKCPICGRGYAQRGNMKSHLRIHRVSEIDPAVLNKMKPNYIKLLKDFRL
ncbi:zinc finger protein 578-like [Achroia grisella]|uniref:zinc finger protein 578-like n=1 Tax=Achroia grisella TaxID=688607 RepID=UPI0027D33FE3|nr:zinc finger protein 578-like [Achroia grisella]